MAKLSVLTVVASLNSSVLGSLSILQDNEATRKVQYLRFNDITVAGKGKNPNKQLEMTVSSFQSDVLAFAGRFERATLLDVVSVGNPSLAMKMSKVEDNEEETLLSGLSRVGKWVEDNANQTASGPVKRNVEENITSKLADILLVAAGTTGVIPTSYDFASIFAKAFTMAEDKAQKLGVDTLGQFRLKAEKTKTEATVEATEEVEA